MSTECTFKNGGNTFLLELTSASTIIYTWQGRLKLHVHYTNGHAIFVKMKNLCLFFAIYKKHQLCWTCPEYFEKWGMHGSLSIPDILYRNSYLGDDNDMSWNFEININKSKEILASCFSHQERLFQKSLAKDATHTPNIFGTKITVANGCLIMNDNKKAPKYVRGV